MGDSGLGSTLKGQIAVTLLGIECVQRSNGRINFAIPYVDDEGVDLLFCPRKGEGRVILAQVKSRTTPAGIERPKSYRSNVRRQSFKARDNYYLVFVTFSEDQLRLDPDLWFIPSTIFESSLTKQSNANPYVFQATFGGKIGMWADYQTTLDGVAGKIVAAFSAGGQ